MGVKPLNKLQILKDNSNDHSDSKNTLDKELDKLSQPNGNGTISSKRQEVIMEQCDEMIDSESFTSSDKGKVLKKAKTRVNKTAKKDKN